VADYAADLARYELAITELKFDPLPAEDPLGTPVEADLPARPEVAPGVRWVQLAYDVPALVEEIELGRPPVHAEPAPTYVVLRNLPRKRLPEVFRISAAMAALLARCDGESDVEEIRRRTGGPAAAVDEALERLSTIGLIRMGRG
jgi:hypothetical protein